jgi:uncharacterized protein with PIN domain
MRDRLLLDSMLGKLATYLRMCGYDAAYVLDGVDPADDPGDDAIRRRATGSDRTIFTRDRELAARADDVLLLRSREVADQLAELDAAGYDLTLDAEPDRCGSCNGDVHRVDAGASLPAYAPDPAGTDCWRCRECRQVFWKGSHWDDVRSTLDAV